MSFLQRLGYLVFLQVLLLPCLAYSTLHVSLGQKFRFCFASFCYCCSYTYFILVGPFCFGLFVFHSAPGAYFVWNEIFLFVSAVRDCSCPGAGYLSEKIVWGIWSKTVRLWDPGFCLKPKLFLFKAQTIMTLAGFCLRQCPGSSSPVIYPEKGGLLRNHFG